MKKLNHAAEMGHCRISGFFDGGIRYHLMFDEG
jgi:hypothetical protein